ncbi:MAG: non-heme iron oxygenase ferredoxin subunit [Dokdonella sp.]
MSEWLRVCAMSELLPGENQVLDHDGVSYLAVNIDGEVYAVENVCTHDYGELSGGTIEGFEVECPRHGARFDVRSGAATLPPAYEPIAKFPVKVEDGVVFLRDDR